MNILVICGSLRKDSFNLKLATIVVDYIKTKLKMKAKLILLKDYNLPIFNQDDEKKKYPLKANKLFKLISETDNIIFVSPEYNGGVPGGLKNIIDWLSRNKKGNAWNNKKYCLMGATIGPLGTYGNFVNLSQILLKVKGWVYGNYCGIAFAEKSFNDKNELIEDRDKKQIKSTLEGFLKDLK